MAGMVEKKLQELGVVVPEPTTPSANYVPFVRTGNLLMVSGQICYEGGKLVAVGKLGGLFLYLMDNPQCVSAGYRDRLQDWPTHRVVCDYIAGMTDAYLLHVHQELLG